MIIIIATVMEIKAPQVFITHTSTSTDDLRGCSEVGQQASLLDVEASPDGTFSGSFAVSLKNKSFDHLNI